MMDIDAVMAASERVVVDSFGDRVVTCVLAGSVAAGTAQRWRSDLDLLVVLPQRFAGHSDAILARECFTAAYVRLCHEFALRPDLNWPAEVAGEDDIDAALSGAGLAVTETRAVPRAGENNSFRYWVSQTAFGLAVHRHDAAERIRRRAWRLMVGIIAIDAPSPGTELIFPLLMSDRSWWSRWNCPYPDLSRHEQMLRLALADLENDGLLRQSARDRWRVNGDADAAWRQRLRAVAVEPTVPPLDQDWHRFRTVARNATADHDLEGEQNDVR
jgi:hypothetical protein